MFGENDPFFDAVCEDDPFFDAVCEGEGDVTDTEETFTLRCEAAAERALWEADRLAVPDRGDRGVLRDGDTPAEPEVVVHKDADGNLTGPRQAAHIGTTGGADRLPLLDRADRTAVPLGGVVRDGHPPAESRGAGTDVVLHDDAGGNTARPRQVALIGAHRVPLPDRADRAEVPLGGVVLHGHTPAEPRGAGTDVVLHDDAGGNTARPHQVAPIRATGVSDQPTLPVGGSPRAHGATAAAAATPGIQQAPVTPRAPDAGGRAADGGVDACSDQNPEPAGPSGLPPALALATRRAFQLRLRCGACGARMRGSATCTACGAATATQSAEHDRARRIRFRGTQVKARKLLMDDERLRPVRVSAAQHYHVRDQPDAYAAAVRRNVQRLADAVVSPDYHAQVEGRDHLLDSYFSVLSFGASRFVNDPIAGIVRTPLPAAQLASFFAGYATQVRAQWGRRKRVGTRASRHLCAPIRRPGRPLNTARFVAVCVWVAALLTQDTETNQLVMMPGGLYSDFLINGVGFGTVKALRVALLAASKAHCAGISAVVEWQLAGQLATLLGDRWPTGAVTSFLFGPHVATTVLSEVDDFLSGGTDALRLPSSGGKDARALHAVPCAAAARRAAAALVLGPLWRLYCVEKYPQRTGTGAPSRRVCAADFVNATLPTRVLDMALRRLSSRSCSILCSRKKTQCRGEQQRAGVDISDNEPYSLHANAGAINSADGGASHLTSTVKYLRARISTVHRREFPALPNPNQSDVVNTAVAAMARVKGTAHPFECDALWDERATRLYALLDIDVPRDLQFAAQAAIGEGAGFRVSEVCNSGRRARSSMRL